MNHKMGFRVLMTIGGIVTLMIGLGHIVMPEYGYRSEVPESMSPVLTEHFYYLGTYAICMFLIGFSLLSLFFSKFTVPVASAVVSSVLCAFWMGRAVLEFIYPVHLQIFFLADPHVVLAFVTIALSIIYFLTTAKSWYLISRAKQIKD